MNQQVNYWVRVHKVLCSVIAARNQEKNMQLRWVIHHDSLLSSALVVNLPEVFVIGPTMIYVNTFTASAIHASNHLLCLDICQSWVGSMAIKSCDSTLFTCLNIGQSWQNSHNAWQFSKIILCLMKVYGCKKVILANFVVIFMQFSRHPSCCINSWPGAN